MIHIRFHPLQGITFPACIVLLSDTHVPDRVPKLPERLLEVIDQESPDLILHAGDISIAPVLQRLSGISPVLAARGNRDFLINPHLPLSHYLDLGGVRTILTHGHGSAWRYMSDKLKYLRHGYDFQRYQAYFQRDYPEADLILFGHTHTPEDVLVDGCRYLNPGSTYACPTNDDKPRVIAFRFLGDGQYSYRWIYI